MDPAADPVARLGLPAGSSELLRQALTHGSFLNEHPDAPVASNERLEFLGDAVVSLVVSRALYERHPDEDEGALTARRAAIVSTRGLARIALRIGIDRLVVLGAGAERSGERRRASVLAATLEAVAGAVYLEHGPDAARAWLLGLLNDELDAATPLVTLKSPKSRLQEVTYASWGVPPTYRLVSAEGPDHAKRFVVDAVVGGEVLGRGEGGSRREAETDAAGRAVSELEARGLHLARGARTSHGPGETAADPGRGYRPGPETAAS
jgi:ribonuclease-3